MGGRITQRTQIPTPLVTWAKGQHLPWQPLGNGCNLFCTLDLGHRQLPRTSGSHKRDVQAIEKETTPGQQHSIVSLVSHKQRRAAELLPAILLAKRLLGEVRHLLGFMPICPAALSGALPHKHACPASRLS